MQRNANNNEVNLSRFDDSLQFQESFKQISKPEAVAFWESIGKTSSPEELDKHMTDVIRRQQRHRTRQSNMGRYLPLSVYEKQGFDPDRIMREITDTKEVPGLGTCYRVAIPESGDIFDRDTIREQTLHSNPTGVPTAAATGTPNTALGNPAAKAAAKDNANTSRRAKGEATSRRAGRLTVLETQGPLSHPQMGTRQC